MKTIRMRKADWQKWDAALRSGEYKQGQHALENDGKFCCLGVLEHCLTGKTELNFDGSSCLNPSVAWLDKHGIEFCGRDSKVSPPLPALGTLACAANDQGHSFIEIADAIKECVDFTDEEN